MVDTLVLLAQRLIFVYHNKLYPAIFAWLRW
jgi:hypothetical protein